MTTDRGKLVGLFEIEKYPAHLEETINQFNEEQHVLLARADFYKKMGLAASTEEMISQHMAHSEELWQQVQERLHAFRDEHATDVVSFPNGLLNGGITLMWNLIIGASAVHFDSTNSRLVIGTSNTAFSAAHTGVQSSLVTLTMDGGYPAVSAQSTSWRATANTATGNGSWQEFCITNNTTAMNRAVSNQGTKTSSDIWVPTLTITLA